MWLSNKEIIISSFLNFEKFENQKITFIVFREVAFKNKSLILFIFVEEKNLALWWCHSIWASTKDSSCL